MTPVRCPGYFTDASLVRQVHREHVVALGGPRALLLMAAHPVAFEGFFAHTGDLDEPYARLRRTAEVLATITYGLRADADRMTRRVRARHRRVRGELSVPAGRFPAGTPYAADDPVLLLWILASLVDSSLAVHDRYVRTLSRDERNAYWQDFRLVGRLFGLPRSEMPRDIDEFDGYMAAMLTGGDLHVTDRAREVGVQIVLRPPVALHQRPLLELANFITVGMLPADLRNAYGLRWDPARALVLQGGAQYTRRVLMPLLPSRVRYARSAAA
jgi:uncharacterized protein (DUF2236 family)